MSFNFSSEYYGFTLGFEYIAYLPTDQYHTKVVETYLRKRPKFTFGGTTGIQLWTVET